MKHAILAAAVALPLAGCLSTGAGSSSSSTATTSPSAAFISAPAAEVQQKFAVGKTTKEEVRATYGDPTSVSLNAAGQEDWIYNQLIMDKHTYLKVFANGLSPIDSKVLDVTFDKSGVVSNFVLRIEKVKCSSDGNCVYQQTNNAQPF